jgi:hypothetical protein
MTSIALVVAYPRVRIVVIAVVALAAAATRPAGAVRRVEAAAAPQAKSACALVTAADVQPLAGRVVDGKAEPPDPLGSLACRYEWGAGRTNFSVIVINGDASRMWPGMSPALVKQGLLGAAMPGNRLNSSAVSGIGDAAILESSATTQAKATAYVKGRILIITLEGPNAGGKKDQVLALLKTAAARL